MGMALQNALTLIALSVGVLFARPGRGVMGLAARNSSGGMLVRRLFPASFISFFLTGWLRLKGQRAGYYSNDLGVMLFAMLTIVIFACLMWWAAKSLDRTDCERERAEEALRASVEQYRVLFYNNPQAMWVYDLDTLAFLAVNQAAVVQYEYSEEEFLGMTIKDIRPAEDISSLLDQALNRQTGFKAAGLWRHKKKDGTIIDVEITSHTINFLGKRANLVLVNDVTEQNRSERALAERTESLARSNAELEQFAYVASHDLKEPLRMVASYCQLLDRRYKGKFDEKADKYIGYAVDGAVRMQSLINDLLEFSRVGTQGKEFEATSCEKVLGETIVLLQMAIRESGASITSDPLPTVRGDALQLLRLFQNLITNAIKFHGQQPPRIHVSANKSGKEWIFSVSDNGIGIEQRYFERIFIIFQRLHNRAEYPGTGMGLAICKKIVGRHGGRLWVESEPGKGSTFYFTIPHQGG